MRLARITALIMLMALSGCARLRPTQQPTQNPTINQAAQQIVASTGAIVARSAPHRYGLTYGATYGATGGSEVGSFPNASPLSGSERILADQNSQTVNILPSQIEQYLGLPVGLSFPLTVANGGTGTSSPGLIAGTNVTITGAWPDQTVNAGASMVYPGAGLANSTGSAWGTSVTSLAGLDSVLGITGTPSSSTYLRGDGTWATPTGSGTVNSGNAGQVGCYAATGTAISGCGLANGLAITSGTLGISEAVNAQTGTSYTVATTDCGKQITLSNAGAIAVTVPQANGSFAGCQFDVTNIGAGTATLTPTTSTINGAASLAVAQNRQCTVNSDGTNWQVIGCTALVTGGGSGQPQDIQTFSVSGTWTKPAWTSTDANATTKAICTGGGGGGGSGSVEPSGTAAPGGGGGGGGATADMLFQTSALAATVPVTVGLGGTGGIARTSTSNGQNGGNGGSSSFSALTAPGGGYGSGGATGTSTSGGGGAGILTGGNGGTNGTMCAGVSSTGTGSGGNPGCPTGGAGGGGDQSSGNAGSAGGPTFAGGAGGGAGGGLTTAPAASTGGAGGAVASATGPAGGATCTAGTAGTNGGAYVTGSAGSGGGSCATAATNAGAGGNGGTGSGGGGGGANINGDGNSGAGGNGGNGECVVITSY